MSVLLGLAGIAATAIASYADIRRELNFIINRDAGVLAHERASALSTIYLSVVQDERHAAVRTFMMGEYSASGSGPQLNARALEPWDDQRGGVVRTAFSLLILVAMTMMTLPTTASGAYCECPDGSGGVCCEGSCGCVWTNPPEPPPPDPKLKGQIGGGTAESDCYCFCSSSDFPRALANRWTLDTIISLRCRDLPVKTLASMLDIAIRDVDLALPVRLYDATQTLEIDQMSCREVIRWLGLLEVPSR